MVNASAAEQLERDLSAIKSNYIDKIVGFLSGESKRVSSNKDFMDTYQIIVNQCDMEDNNEALYQFF